MTEKDAYALRQFLAQNVLHFAGVVEDGIFRHLEHIRKKALRQSLPSDQAPRHFSSLIRKMYIPLGNVSQTLFLQRLDERSYICVVRTKAEAVNGLVALLLEHPQQFQCLVYSFFIGDHAHEINYILKA
jgi:hypothetical protein